MDHEETRDLAIALYETSGGALEAIAALESGRPTRPELSIAGKEPRVQERVIGCHGADHLVFHGGLGACMARVLPLLRVRGFFSLPRIGPTLLGGRLLSLVLRQTDSTPEPLGVLYTALLRIGVPGTDARHYEEAVRAGRLLVLVEETPELAGAAQEILDRAAPTESAVHRVPPATDPNASADTARRRADRSETPRMEYRTSRNASPARARFPRFGPSSMAQSLQSLESDDPDG